MKCTRNVLWCATKCEVLACHQSYRRYRIFILAEPSYRLRSLTKIIYHNMVPNKK
jgi:hypothetical protein